MSDATTSSTAIRRAFPTLLKIGAAENLAYRAEFVVWMLTGTMPLIMLALWTTVAGEGAFGRYSSDDFVAYYLAMMVTRQLTGSWVVWQIDDEVRTGILSLRLLRPIHPFVTYAALHLSALPVRALVSVPLALILLASSAADDLTRDWLQWALFPVALAGSWLIGFFIMIALGTVSFWVERAYAIFDIYLAASGIVSGYLVPLELMPGWVQTLAAALPFRYMVAYPVELVTGSYDRGDAFVNLGLQWAFVVGTGVVALALWRRGVRRFEAFGS